MTIFNQAAVLKNQYILDSFQVSASCTRAPSTCCNPQTGLQTRYWSSLIPNLTFQEDFVPSDRLAWCCSSQLHHHGITVHSSRKQWASVRPHWQRRLFKCNANLMPSLNLNKAHQHAQGNSLTHPAFNSLWPSGTNPYPRPYLHHNFGLARMSPR